MLFAATLVARSRATGPRPATPCW